MCSASETKRRPRTVGATFNVCCVSGRSLTRYYRSQLADMDAWGKNSTEMVPILGKDDFVEPAEYKVPKIGPIGFGTSPGTTTGIL